LACGNGGSGLRKGEELKNKGSALFSSGVVVTAGSGNDALTPFRAEFEFPDQTRQPVAGVRVLAGVKMSNPYPNPGTYPRVFKTRDNP